MSAIASKLTLMTEPNASNGLVVREAAAAPVGHSTTPAAFGLPLEFADQMRFAEIVSKSDLVDKKLQGKPENVFMVMLKALGLGISFDLAIAQTHVIDNKVSPSAELLRILLRRAGHDLEITDLSDKVVKATLTLAHRKSRPVTMEYSIAKAQSAGLTGKQVWKQHPESMLVAAVTRLLVRYHCPDVAAGLSLDVDMVGAEYGNDTAATIPEPRSEAQIDDRAERAKAILDQARDTTQRAKLTELGKEARDGDLLDVGVGDGSRSLRQALMDRLAELDAAATAQ